MSDNGSPPLVAIATPVLNGEAYLEATMACVQAQTYPALVHVVLDNASTDATPHIIDNFRGMRVPVLSHRNGATIPLAENWNAVVAMVPANAAYFAVLCADDLLEPDFVSKMVGVAESDRDVELVGCMHRFGDAVMPSSLPRSRSVFDGREVVRSFLDKKSNDIPHMWGLFRRHAEDFASNFYDGSMYMYDTDACIRAMVRGKFGFVHEPLYFYRQHDSSISESVIKGTTLRLFESMEQIERWGPRVMTEAQYRACARRHQRAIYRYMLAAIAGRHDDLRERYRAFLALRNSEPGILDFAHSVVEWPLSRLARHARRLRDRCGLNFRSAGSL